MTHITIERAKLEQALEALEPFSTPNWAGTGVDEANDAITAIKQALNTATPLAAPVQSAERGEPEYEAAWHKVWPDAGSFVRASSEDLIKFAKAIAAQPAVPLTDEQVATILGALPAPPTDDGSALHAWAMQAVRALAGENDAL